MLKATEKMIEKSLPLNSLTLDGLKKIIYTHLAENSSFNLVKISELVQKVL